MVRRTVQQVVLRGMQCVRGGGDLRGLRGGIQAACRCFGDSATGSERMQERSAVGRWYRVRGSYSQWCF